MESLCQLVALSLQQSGVDPGLGQVHSVTQCTHVFSNHRGQHIPLPKCSTMLHKALLQGPSSLADVTLRALVTRDGVNYSSPNFLISQSVTRETGE